MSSTQARTTSPTSCRRASRPTDSAMTRMASCGWMKQSDIGGSWKRERLTTETVGGGVDVTFAPARPALALLATSRGGSDPERVRSALECSAVADVARKAKRRALRRGPVGQREVERLDRHRYGAGERACAALQQQRIADREDALGGQRRAVARRQSSRAREMQGVRAQLIQPERAERAEQFIASHAPEAGERESLEHALEPPFGAPARIAAERGRLAARAGRALHPLAVGQQRVRAAGGIVRGARPERHVRAAGERAARLLLTGAAGESQANAGERIIALQRREVGGQEADPRCPLEIVPGQRADLAEDTGGRLGQRLQAGAREGELSCQAPGVGGSVHARNQRRAGAVLQGPTLAVHARALAACSSTRPRLLARGRARGRAPAAGSRLGGVARQRLAADRAALYEAVVAAEGRHGAGGRKPLARARAAPSRRSLASARR